MMLKLFVSVLFIHQRYFFFNENKYLNKKIIVEKSFLHMLTLYTVVIVCNQWQWSTVLLVNRILDFIKQCSLLEEHSFQVQFWTHRGHQTNSDPHLSGSLFLMHKTHLFMRFSSKRRRCKCVFTSGNVFNELILEALTGTNFVNSSVLGCFCHMWTIL